MICLGLLTVAGACLLAHAADAPTSDTRNVRLIKPFSELKDLTPEQTEKLKVIHKKYLDDLKVLETKQREDMMAALSDPQKREIADIETQEKTGKKTATKKPPANAPANNGGGASKEPDAK
jgi:hypothetical protein